MNPIGGVSARMRAKHGLLPHVGQGGPVDVLAVAGVDDVDPGGCTSWGTSGGVTCMSRKLLGRGARACPARIWTGRAQRSRCVLFVHLGFTDLLTYRSSQVVERWIYLPTAVRRHGLAQRAVDVGRRCVRLGAGWPAVVCAPAVVRVSCVRGWSALADSRPGVRRPRGGVPVWSGGGVEGGPPHAWAGLWRTGDVDERASAHATAAHGGRGSSSGGGACVAGGRVRVAVVGCRRRAGGGVLGGDVVGVRHPIPRGGLAVAHGGARHPTSGRKIRAVASRLRSVEILAVCKRWVAILDLLTRYVNRVVNSSAHTYAHTYATRHC